MKTKIIKELRIKVEEECQIQKIKDIKIPKGWRLLTFQEAVFIFDNDLLRNFPDKEWEIIQQVSKENKKKGYNFSVLYDGYGGRLYLLTYDEGYDRYGRAFGVRFCRDIKKELI